MSEMYKYEIINSEGKVVACDDDYMTKHGAYSGGADELERLTKQHGWSEKDYEINVVEYDSDNTSEVTGEDAPVEGAAQKADGGEYYEVDLRSRKDGDTVETIYSGDDYDKVWAARNEWFKKNMPQWDDESDVEDLIDGTDGVFAYVYSLTKGMEILGVGKHKDSVEATA
jgi:hypothetical protein